MKIYPIYNSIKRYTQIAVLTSGLTLTSTVAKSATRTAADTYISMQKAAGELINNLPHEGSTDSLILSKAPSCDIIVQGIKKKAKVVVDVAHNILYKYTSDGSAEIAYPIATGKASTPTHKGIRIVSHVETANYRNAPRHTKRYRNPKPYGKKCIILDILNPKTGERQTIGEFIHGTDTPESIGKKVSGGCMRMSEKGILDVAGYVKSGDIVIIQ